jgi:hypothetical protein
MFKTTGKSGLRRANSGAGAPQAAHRIASPNNRFRNGFVQRPGATPFLPETLEQHSFDSDSNPRVDE